MASADVEGALTASNTMMLKGFCCKKVFILNLSALFCANPVISRVELICLVDSDPWNVAWPSDTHRRLEVWGDKQGCYQLDE